LENLISWAVNQLTSFVTWINQLIPLINILKIPIDGLDSLVLYYIQPKILDLFVLISQNLERYLLNYLLNCRIHAIWKSLLGKGQ
jgi:hypothetical protein